MQEAPQEMEGNKASAKQRTVRPTNQLLLTFPPFPVGHSAHEHGMLNIRNVKMVVRNCDDIGHQHVRTPYSTL